MLLPYTTLCLKKVHQEHPLLYPFSDNISFLIIIISGQLAVIQRINVKDNHTNTPYIKYKKGKKTHTSQSQKKYTGSYFFLFILIRYQTMVRVTDFFFHYLFHFPFCCQPAPELFGNLNQVIQIFITANSTSLLNFPIEDFTLMYFSSSLYPFCRSNPIFLDGKGQRL